MSKHDQYDRAAEGWSETQYADPAAYLEHRARLVVDLGVKLLPGDEVLDLACGDGRLGDHLLRFGMRYRGVDMSTPMTQAAAGHFGGRAPVTVGDLNTYVPPAPVAATTVFRAIYYTSDRREFFARVADFTTKKLVFDLNPRQFDVRLVVSELHAAGFTCTALRPFFVPQTRALPRLAIAVLRAAERSGPLARLALRHRFTYLVAAWRGASSL